MVFRVQHGRIVNLDLGLAGIGSAGSDEHGEVGVAIVLLGIFPFPIMIFKEVGKSDAGPMSSSAEVFSLGSSVSGLGSEPKS